ncbi:MAG: hypothetical protein HOA66_01555 [Candidatus Marinimicrobia bacterium]|nr:hypothetical protein [Candidatus Neomarinimicrobiota bacterium]
MKYFFILAFLIISCDNTTEPELEIREVKYLLTNYCDGYEQTETIEDDYSGGMLIGPMDENDCYAYETPYFANNYISSHNFDESEFSVSDTIDVTIEFNPNSPSWDCLLEIDHIKFKSYAACDNISSLPNTSRIFHYTNLGHFEIIGNTGASYFIPDADENYAFGYY